MATERRWHGYAWAVGACAACTAAGLGIQPWFDAVNIAMMYLLAVVVVALRHSRGPAIATSVLCLAAFNFFFVPPRYTLAVDDPQYLLAFVIILAVGLIVSELTERGRERAQREARLESEAQTERMRSALLASISHDLRTPLTVLAGASSTLAEQAEQMTAVERRQLSESIYGQVTRLAEHVEKLLQMTRLENRSIRIEKDWTAMPEIVDSALRCTAERLKAHHVLVDLPEEVPLVYADPALIEQALVNLLENAAQHTPAGTVVRILASVTGSEVTVSVEDTGPGIPGGELDRVFEKFHQGHADARAGVGLGRAICRAILELHGGRVWARAMPGGGAGFSFSIRCEPAPPLPAEVEVA